MNKLAGFAFLALALVGAIVAYKRIAPAVLARARDKTRAESVVETVSGLPGTRTANYADTSDQERNHLRTYGAIGGPATPYNYGMI